MAVKSLPQTFDIEIKIGPDGTLDSTVTGVAGADCHKLQELFDDLGTEVSHRHTPDWYKVQTVARTIKAGAR